MDFPIGIQYNYKKEETSDELSVADDHSDDFSLLEIDLRAEEEVTWGLSASMPEYVYALHDFTPENEDDIQFSAGDRIEVIEKDEMYQDGWWQVCFPLPLLHAFSEGLRSQTSLAGAGAKPLRKSWFISSGLHNQRLVRCSTSERATSRWPRNERI